jgi:prophage regulatory protein
MDINQERIVRLDVLLDRTGLSRSSIYRKMNDGSFPMRLQIGIHSSGWLESEINRWISNPMGFDQQLEADVKWSHDNLDDQV